MSMSTTTSWPDAMYTCACACHRLMCRAPRPKAEAMLGERPVPIPLQHLHHRLLDEAVEHRRHSHIELHFDPVSLWVRLR